MPVAPITNIILQGQPVDVLRLELAYPELQGNKHFKLKYNLQRMIREGYKTVLTFGGVFSNHIHATAVACHALGIRSVGVFRGENDPNNPTLQHVRNLGMECIFIDRSLYRKRNDPSFAESLAAQFEQTYVLPEGGTNTLAIKGCTEILSGLETAYDLVVCAVGTGGTLSGLINTPGLTAEVLGISALKSEKDVLSPAVLANVSEEAAVVQWQILFDNSIGGYGAYHEELMSYIRAFEQTHTMLPDPIYTAKMFFVVEKLIKAQQYQGKRILCIHTGGLQGWAGWNYRYHTQMRIP